MIHSFLTDKATGKRYDLTALAEQHGCEISVGRIHNGNLIEVGQDDNLEVAKRVSRHHATITYLGKFYIKDHSTNGTSIDNGRNMTSISGEGKVPLRNGYELWFGPCGPFIYEEINDVPKQPLIQ